MFLLGVLLQLHLCASLLTYMAKRDNKMANLAYKFKSDLDTSHFERTNLFERCKRNFVYEIFSSLAGKRTQCIVAIDHNHAGQKGYYMKTQPIALPLLCMRPWGKKS